MRERNIWAHTKIIIKDSLGGRYITYIRDGESIPPSSQVIYIYNEGDAVPNGPVQGIHDHDGIKGFGYGKFIRGHFVGGSIPIGSIKPSLKTS